METVKTVFGISKKVSVHVEDVCKEMKPFVHQEQKMTDTYNEMSTVSNGRIIRYREIGSFLSKWTVCDSRPATKLEMDNAEILRKLREKKP